MEKAIGSLRQLGAYNVKSVRAKRTMEAIPILIAAALAFSKEQMAHAMRNLKGFSNQLGMGRATLRLDNRIIDGNEQCPDSFDAQTVLSMCLYGGWAHPASSLSTRVPNDARQDHCRGAKHEFRTNNIRHSG